MDREIFPVAPAASRLGSACFAERGMIDKIDRGQMCPPTRLQVRPGYDACMSDTTIHLACLCAAWCRLCDHYAPGR